VRAAYSRLAEDGLTKTEEEMAAVPVKGLHRIEVRDRDGNPSEAVLELKYRRMQVLAPLAKAKDYGPLQLTVLYAVERGTPKGRDPINWKLLTDLPVGSREEAIEKLRWYAMRWKIELFHKILKSGCKVEHSRLRTAPRLVNLIATCCILGWRIFWMTMVQRSNPSAVPTLALTQLELELLDRVARDKHSASSRPKDLYAYLTKIARLGGYLDRANDPPPGIIVMWRGLARLTDLSAGYSIATEKCG
jgi:hypothetical protein